MLLALDFAVGPSYEIVIVGEHQAEDARAMMAALRRQFVPNKVVIFRPQGDLPEISRLAQFTRDQVSINGKATAYVCLNYNCRLPVTDPEQMLELLGVPKQG